MRTVLLITALIGLLASCAAPIPSKYTLNPGQKFIDGEVIGRKLRIQSRKAINEPPEIILFQDGEGNDFTIYEQ